MRRLVGTGGRRVVAAGEQEPASALWNEPCKNLNPQVTRLSLAGWQRAGARRDARLSFPHPTWSGPGQGPLFRAELGRRVPDDGIFGEEGGVTSGSLGRRWIIDPINGTTYFTRRVPLFSAVL
ncbi:inositol monophosphatase family protein [Streptomyces sp. NPDC014872]|uniref:inositol monophosphatase family protein n=1 Tax=unclassified Streptomyces TaxID=2593676 RepID=UPI0036F78635